MTLRKIITVPDEVLRKNAHKVTKFNDDLRTLIDDMVDTAGTLCQAAGALKAKGAKSVSAYITHAILSGPAIDRINASDLDELVVTDTVPLSEAAAQCSKIRRLEVAELLAETIRRISQDESVSSLYVD